MYTIDWLNVFIIAILVIAGYYCGYLCHILKVDDCNNKEDYYLVKAFGYGMIILTTVIIVLGIYLDVFVKYVIVME